MVSLSSSIYCTLNFIFVDLNRSKDADSSVLGKHTRYDQKQVKSLSLNSKQRSIENVQASSFQITKADQLCQKQQINTKEKGEILMSIQDQESNEKSRAVINQNQSIVNFKTQGSSFLSATKVKQMSKQRHRSNQPESYFNKIQEFDTHIKEIQSKSINFVDSDMNESAIDMKSSELKLQNDYSSKQTDSKTILEIINSSKDSSS